MVEVLREFFEINRTVVLFVYGLTFFVMGLGILLNSRRHSRLRLARDLRWLGVFGILHGAHEWGHIFIPLQAEYLPDYLVYALQTLQVILLATSFLCLTMFGATVLEGKWPKVSALVDISGAVWGISFVGLIYLAPLDQAHNLANILGRYLLCIPGSLLAAYGLRYQTRLNIVPLNIQHIVQRFDIASWTLVAYALFGGVLVQEASFFPANTLNRSLLEIPLGLPIEVWRSSVGFVLAITIIQALEVFEIELDRLIEEMEVEQVQAAERERIGQEIHDGAMQGVYSASLILESMTPLVAQDSELARRLHQAQSVLKAVNLDLRSYMVSLRAETPTDPLLVSLQKLIADPRFRGLLDISLEYDSEPHLKPMQVHHVVAIVQEGLSNTVRHARARRASIVIKAINGTPTLSIEDNGRGFAPENQSIGYGLRSMRDRARLIGGRLEIETVVGKGTRIILHLPEETI